MAGNEWVFLSRQRADFEDLGCPRAWETRFARENLQTRVARKSVMFGVFWVVLGCPLGSPRCSRALLALLGCSWLLLVAPSPPTREPQRATQP